MIGRGFVGLFLGTAAGVALSLYAFIVLVDPFDAMPFHARLDRGPVDGNARYSFPALARDARFDSALFGTSTARLLRPAELDAALGGRFVNLAMNSATAYEQTRMLQLFLAAHPSPRTLMIGLDSEWCVTGAGFHRFGFGTGLPEWLYGDSRWARLGHVFNLYALERAGQAFAEWTGLKPRVYGRDGYTSFVPDDARYDPVRVAELMRGAEPWAPPEVLGPDPAAWAMPGLDLLAQDLSAAPAGTRKILFFVPYHRSLLPLEAGPAQAVLAECKRRVALLARATPATVAIDFMLPSPITMNVANYWDPHHYRIGIAHRLVDDLAAGVGGRDLGGDGRVLTSDRL